MKRLLVCLLLALFLAVPAGAQIVEDPTTGGGATTIISGTTPITGGATTQVCYNQGGFLKCGDAGLIYAESTDILTMLGGATVGSTTTAGTGTTTILANISGSSATSNFLNITGTFPATLSAEARGLAVYITGDNDAQQQYGIYSEFSQSGSGAGGAIKGQNTSTTTSNAIGVYGYSLGAATRNIGVLGQAQTGTNLIGGFFALGQVFPTTSVALGADNGSVAANIFEARDNGTAVFSIVDGGQVQTINGTLAAPGVSVNSTNYGLYFHSSGGSNVGVGVSAGGTYIANFAASANPVVALVLGATRKLGWYPTDTVAATAYDTMIGREAAAVVEMGNDVNGAAVAQTFKAHDGITGTDIAGANLTISGGRGTGAGAGGNRIDQTSRELGTGTTAQTLQDRTVVVAKAKALTESAATSVVLINVASGAFGGGEMEYTVQASDATDHQARSGRIQWAVVNKAGTETCTVSGASEAADSSTVAASTGTLTYAITTDTTPTNGCNIQFNAVSSLTQTVLNIAYRITANGGTTTLVAQ